MIAYIDQSDTEIIILKGHSMFHGIKSTEKSITIGVNWTIKGDKERITELKNAFLKNATKIIEQNTGNPINVYQLKLDNEK